MQLNRWCKVSRYRRPPHRRKPARVCGAAIALLSILLTGSSTASATTITTTDCSGYHWGGYETTAYSNQGVGGYIRGTDVTVPDSAAEHALLYVSSYSESDPSNGNVDWAQAGFGKGSVDQTNTDGYYEVYLETNQYNFPSPQASFFASDPTGNEFFEVFFTGQIDSAGRGLYDAFENSTYLGSAWEVAPTDNTFFAQDETDCFYGTTASRPTISYGDYGTNGNFTNPGYSTSTELFIVQHGGGSVLWSPSTIASALHAPGGYFHVYALNPISAFKASGS